MKFAILKSEAPLLSTEDFKNVFTFPLPLNEDGLLKPVELVAFKGTPLVVVKQCSEWIFQVEIEGFSKTPLFADVRFLEMTQELFPLKEKKCPNKNTVLNHLVKLLGNIYIWGGNWDKGIPELLELYPPRQSLDLLSKKRWTLEGLDCSGLLYQVTEGFTPRNTPQLLHFGEGLPIKGLSLEAIAEKLKPLDLIVWLGHIVIVLDTKTIIESSCSRGGVVTSDLQERLSLIMQERTPANTWEGHRTFVIRRFLYDEIDR